MFVDEAEIHIKAGNGGHGCLSFRREKYIPKGGPDGGDGGMGGGVFAQAVTDSDTLMDFASKHHWKAKNGLPGEGKNKTGRQGDDITLRVPVGTLIYDRDTGVLLKDMAGLGEPVCLARGGRGGRGNVHFARSDHQTPEEHEPGQLGEERWLRLELKLIADVGLVGMPNAGKSTLLSRLSAARPKIAAYPFTTIRPQLGIVELSGGRRFVMADIPGLIEGAHEGAGLGDEFLKHVERTRTILHIVDVGLEGGHLEPAEAYRTIRAELEKYSPALAGKEELIVANKIDLTDGEERARELATALGKEVLCMSAVTGDNLDAVTQRIWDMVSGGARVEETFDVPPPPMPIPPHLRDQ